MNDGLFFDRLDAVPLAIATERFGMAFATASMSVAGAVVADQRISPLMMTSGICRAHAAGLASSLAAVGSLVGDDPAKIVLLQEDLLAACIAMIRQMLDRED